MLLKVKKLPVNFCRQQLTGQILKLLCRLLLLGVYFPVLKLHNQRWLIRVFGRMRLLTLGSNGNLLASLFDE